MEFLVEILESLIFTIVDAVAWVLAWQWLQGRNPRSRGYWTTPERKRWWRK